MAAFGGSPTLVKTLESFSPELVTWSRDGKICFVMLGNLYSLNIATQEISPVTKFDSSKPQDRSFAISPNEERLAYTDSSDGQSDIWMMPTRGGPPVRITNDKAQDSHPVWTPDGQGIIYSSKRNGINQICVVRLDGSQPVQVTVNDSNSNVLDISPDGTKILYSTDRDESDLWSWIARKSRNSLPMPAWSYGPTLRLTVRHSLFKPRAQQPTPTFLIV